MAKWGMAPSSTKATPGAYGSLFKIPAMDSFVVKAVNFAGITSLKKRRFSSLPLNFPRLKMYLRIKRKNFCVAFIFLINAALK